MNSLPVVIVAAMAENRVIGRNGGMPWHLPADMAHFRKLTLGNPIIMGRLTHQSLGKVLDGRHNIILSRQRRFPALDFQFPKCTVVHSLDEAFMKASEVASSNVREIAVIGGASIYEQALPFADRIHLTLVHASFEGDVLFPRISPRSWREVSRTKRSADARNGYDVSFIKFERVRGEEKTSRMTPAT